MERMERPAFAVHFATTFTQHLFDALDFVIGRVPELRDVVLDTAERVIAEEIQRRRASDETPAVSRRVTT